MAYEPALLETELSQERPQRARGSRLRGEGDGEGELSTLSCDKQLDLFILICLFIESLNYVVRYLCK